MNVFGRQREMDELRPTLRDAMQGWGLLVMLVGGLGVSKNCTAQAIAAHSEVQGVQAQ